MIRTPIALLLLASLASSTPGQTPDERRARLREAYLRAGSAAEKEAIRAEMRAMTAGSDALDALLESLRSGERGDAIRRSFHDHFLPLGMRGAREAMERIRRAGLLDAFLAAVLRSESGGEVDPTLREGVRILMETGRLDVFAELRAIVSRCGAGRRPRGGRGPGGRRSRCGPGRGPADPR